MEAKDYSNANLLNKALERADVLSKQFEDGSIDVKTQSLLVEATLNKNPENE